MEEFDDSLDGSIIKHEEQKKEEKKFIYKPGIQHRFLVNAEGKYRADPLVFKYVKEHGASSLRDIRKATGMAERTLAYSVERLCENDVFKREFNKQPCGREKMRKVSIYSLK